MTTPSGSGYIPRRDDGEPANNRAPSPALDWGGILTSAVNFLLSFGLPMADAEDGAQHTALHLFRYASDNPIRSLTAIVWTIAHDWYCGFLRQRDRHRRFLAQAQLAPDAPSADAEVASRDECARILGAVHALPERQKSLILCRLDGLTLTETAEQLGITLPSAHCLWDRAMTTLADILGERR
jgi:DNA-directed RNA polymerase specialized sigma24 family protein